MSAAARAVLDSPEMQRLVARRSSSPTKASSCSSRPTRTCWRGESAW